MARNLVINVTVEDPEQRRNHVSVQRVFNLDDLRQTDIAPGIIREEVARMFRAVMRTEDADDGSHF